MGNGSGFQGDLSSLSMRDLFRMEAESQTAILAQGLLDLEKDTGAEEKLETLMRASHSVKGAARIVGIDAVVAIAHELEECFVAAQRRKIELTSSHIDLFLKAVDVIVKIAHLDEEETKQWLAQNQPVIATLKENLGSVLSGELSVPASGAAEMPLVSAEAPATAAPEKPENRAPISDKAESPVSKSKVAESGVERVIRINADRLTRIMGLSSEMLVESGR
ncbi:MAG: Hpt domain-containing protein, partial [Gammaproteobacteria bacterium]